MSFFCPGICFVRNLFVLTVPFTDVANGKAALSFRDSFWLPAGDKENKSITSTGLWEGVWSSWNWTDIHVCISMQAWTPVYWIHASKCCFTWQETAINWSNNSNNSTRKTACWSVTELPKCRTFWHRFWSWCSLEKCSAGQQVFLRFVEQILELGSFGQNPDHQLQRHVEAGFVSMYLETGFPCLGQCTLVETFPLFWSWLSHIYICTFPSWSNKNIFHFLRAYIHIFCFPKCLLLMIYNSFQTEKFHKAHDCFQKSMLNSFSKD